MRTGGFCYRHLALPLVRSILGARSPPLVLVTEVSWPECELFWPLFICRGLFRTRRCGRLPVLARTAMLTPRAHLFWQSVVCAPAQLALGRDGSTEPDDRGGGGSHSLFAHYSLTIRSLFAHYPLTIHSLLVLTALQGDSHSLFAHYPLIIRSLFTHYLLCSPSTDYSLTIHSPFDSQCEIHQSGARIRGFTVRVIPILR